MFWKLDLVPTPGVRVKESCPVGSVIKMLVSITGNLKNFKRGTGLHMMMGNMQFPKRRLERIEDDG